MDETRPSMAARAAIWTLREDTLLTMLRRCHDGESPDDVYMESYVNLFDHAGG